MLALFGGLDASSLWQNLKSRPNEICVSTPARLIEFIKKKAVKINTRCTFLVIDEADRMLDMGFAPQLRSITGQIRPDRQVLLFSATFEKKLYSLCYDIIFKEQDHPVKIMVGQHD